MEFQSTHSQRVRPKGKSIFIVTSGISIHALTKSATKMVGDLDYTLINFNPRTHKECDGFRLLFKSKYGNFNPRTHKECDV